MHEPTQIIKLKKKMKKNYQNLCLGQVGVATSRPVGVQIHTAINSIMAAVHRGRNHQKWHLYHQ